MTRFRGKYDFNIWMKDNNNIRMNVTVPNNHYFSVGFGKTMTNCDMVLWQANGLQSKTVDLWSKGRFTPDTDSQQDYNSTFTYNGTHVIFISDRKMNTGDSLDFVIKNVTLRMIIALEHKD